jgi:hypothetical protein
LETETSLIERVMAAQAMAIYLRGSTAQVTEEARHAAHQSRNLRQHAALLRALSVELRRSHRANTPRKWPFARLTPVKS